MPIHDTAAGDATVSRHSYIHPSVHPQATANIAFHGELPQSGTYVQETMSYMAGRTLLDAWQAPTLFLSCKESSTARVAWAPYPTSYLSPFNVTECHRHHRRVVSIKVESSFASVPFLGRSSPFPQLRSRNTVPPTLLLTLIHTPRPKTSTYRKHAIRGRHTE